MKREELILARKRSITPQIVLAKQLGISQATYSMIENGYYTPSKEVAEKLKGLFDLPDGYFDRPASGASAL